MKRTKNKVSLRQRSLDDHFYISRRGLYGRVQSLELLLVAWQSPGKLDLTSLEKYGACICYLDHVTQERRCGRSEMHPEL